MRIAVICPEFSKEKINTQPWHYAYHLARSLLRHAKVLLITDVQGDMIKDLEGQMEIVALGGLSIKSSVHLIDQHLKCVKPDVIYLFGNSLSGLYIKRFAALKTPVILNINSAHLGLGEIRNLSLLELLAHYRHLLFSFYPLNRVTRLLNSSCIEMIVTTTNTLACGLRRLGVNGDKIVASPLVFEHRVSWTGTKEEAKESLGLKTHDKVIVYMGPADFGRGVDVLVKAIKNVSRKNANVLKTFLLLRHAVDDDSYSLKYLLTLIRRPFAEGCIRPVVKKMTRENLSLYIHASDIMVFPFKVVPSEPNLSILESMVYGKCIVASDTGSFSEILMPDRGILVPPGDVNELVKALTTILAHEDLMARCGENASRFAKSLPPYSHLGDWTYRLLSSRLDVD